MNYALTAIKRWINPRYSWLPGAVRRSGARILDVGAGALDGRLAKQYWPGSFIVGVNIEPEPAGGGFDNYIQVDLNKGGLSGLGLERESFDYVVSSHLIEHIDDGPKAIDQMADLVRKGGLIYLEWPSEESLTCPIRGWGLNFFDDDTHVRTYSIDQVVTRLKDSGFEILSAGHRRHLARMALAPVLALRRSLAQRRFILYDFWDWTGFCVVVRARRL